MLWLAPAGTPGRHKTGGVPPKPPATPLLSLWPLGVLGLRFAPPETCCCGSRIFVHVRGSGDLGFVSRHKPAEHPIPDVPAAPDVEASCITSCRGRRVSLSLWKTLRRHSMSAVAAQTMGLSRFAERWSHICPRVPFSPGHCRWLGSISSRCSSPAHYEAHFRPPSAFDEFGIAKVDSLRVPHFM